MTCAGSDCFFGGSLWWISLYVGFEFVKDLILWWISFCCKFHLMNLISCWVLRCDGSSFYSGSPFVVDLPLWWIPLCGGSHFVVVLTWWISICVDPPLWWISVCVDLTLWWISLSGGSPLVVDLICSGSPLVVDIPLWWISLCELRHFVVLGSNLFLCCEKCYCFVRKFIFSWQTLLHYDRYGLCIIKSDQFVKKPKKQKTSLFCVQFFCFVIDLTALW